MCLQIVINGKAFAMVILATGVVTAPSCSPLYQSVEALFKAPTVDGLPHVDRCSPLPMIGHDRCPPNPITLSHAAALELLASPLFPQFPLLSLTPLIAASLLPIRFHRPLPTPLID